MTEFFAESTMPAERAEPLRETPGAHSRPGRSRARLAAAAAVISLLAVGAGACSSGSGGHPAAGGSAAAGVATGIKVPAKIGSLTRGAHGPMDARASRSRWPGTCAR